MENVWLMPFKEIAGFLAWWGWEVPRVILKFTGSLLFGLEDSLQFVANLRLWLAVEPMFGDYTWSGRAVGFLMRGLRVIVTLSVYVVVVLAGCVIVISWLALPVLALMRIYF